MKPTKDKTQPAATATPDPKPELVAEQPSPKTPESIVDGVFDAVTTWAARSLTAAKRGLELSARWLDQRAKVVGELATKIGTSSRSNAAKSA